MWKGGAMKNLLCRYPSSEINTVLNNFIYMVATVLESPGMSWDFLFVLECR